MADKKLNEVTKVTDMAYVPVIMSDGSIGQIAKSDLASVVAGTMGVKSGVLTRDTSTTLKLGSGFLFLNIGGSHSSLYHLSYWTTDVTLIGGSPLDSLGSIVQTSDKYQFTITMNGTDAKYYFIGYGLV